jgi:tetratricopeptide (TPR) repeat protein
MTLRRLAVFPGTFSLDAAEAVTADGHQIEPGDVLDLLGHLVDKSLVVFDPLGAEARYRLLETVRQYAAERLTEAGEAPATHRRHRGFFLAFANATHHDLSFWWDTRGWLARVRIDRDNFGTALEWSWTAGEPDECLRLAVALSYYWILDGGVDARQWLQRSLDATVGEASPARVRGLACLAVIAAQAGEPTRAVALLDDARTLAARIDDVTGGGLACELLGGLRSEADDFEPAEQLLNEAGRRFQSANCLAGQWGCHYDLGWVAVARGDPGRAAEEFEQALTLGRRCGSEDLIAHALAALAPVVALTGDTERAQALAADAIEVTRTLALRLFVVMALTRAAEVTMITGQIDRARDTLAEALILLRDVGGHAWVSDVLELTALLAEKTHRTEDAARLFGIIDQLTDGRPTIRAVRSEVDACRTAVARRLGDEPFAAALARGQQLSADKAIAEALATLAQTLDDRGPDRTTRHGPSLHTLS